jgi:outer membrane protein TolC
MLQKLATSLLLVATPAVVHAQWSLDSCLRYAARHNQGMIASLEAAKTAGIQVKEARSNLLPTVNATGQMDYNYKIPVQIFPGELVGQRPGTYVPVRISTPWLASYGVDATVKLVDAGAWQSVKLSILQRQQQDAQTASYKMLLEKNVRIAFYDLQVRLEEQRIAVQQTQTYTQIHRLLTAQFNKGLIDKIILNQSQTLLMNREEAIRKTQTALQVARLTLQGWMGYPFEDSLQVTTDTALQPVQPPVFNAGLLPGYNAEYLKTLVAEKEWKTARSRWWPSLSANAGYNRIAFGNAFDFWQKGSWFEVGTISLRLHVPLLAVKELIHEPARRKTAWQQSLHEFAQYRRDQEQSFQQEALQAANAWQSIQHATEKVDLAQQNVQLVIHKMEKGLVSMPELRQVTDDLYLAQQERLHAKMDYRHHVITLFYLQNHP